MIQYLYHCDTCTDNFLITKSMSESSRDEFCPICKTKLRKDFTPAFVSVDGEQFSQKNWVDSGFKKPQMQEPEPL